MITGYDISSNNPNFGGYDTDGVTWVCVKASEGGGYKNPLRFVQATWVRARKLRLSVYHWVKPNVPAVAQVQNFADAVQGMGAFDWWAPDIEDGEPASDAQWSTVLEAFIAGTRARPEFGDRCVPYEGQFFRAALLPIAQRQGRWWLPDYGKNDGAVHAISKGARPMIHQFTSAHGLDRNVVVDEAAYRQLVGTKPPVPPAPPRILTEEDMEFLFKSKAGTLFLYDRGNVIKFESLNLVRAINAGRALEHKDQLEPIPIEDDAAEELASLAAR